MNIHLIGVAICSALAFAIQSLGPGDASLALYVVGGTDCNHSDSISFDCEEINGRTNPCTNAPIGAPNVQSCKDILVESKVICTQNNCRNVTRDRKNGLAACTKVGCG